MPSLHSTEPHKTSTNEVNEMEYDVLVPSSPTGEVEYEVLVPPSPTGTAAQQQTADLPLLVRECPLPSPSYDSDGSNYSN
ncbi:4775_t:CDS:2 [Scutellospora calospora]|uniref:4775_t:CDS:1 n=1 Tax=Scutellospora calospora TaxID=85575 RepID=A0ACA9K726_9GLOM|nr:4775_t:CDS:2 [Scutellospora calospora]